MLVSRSVPPDVVAERSDTADDWLGSDGRWYWLMNGERKLSFQAPALRARAARNVLYGFVERDGEEADVIALEEVGEWQTPEIMVRNAG
jgi:hypothetical protein